MNKIKNFFNGKLSNYFEIIQQDFIMSSSIFRLNYYCAMVRELFRLFFEQNNNDVLICSWYKEEDENGKKSKPRRADLIRYYLCGGISDEICVEYDFLDSIHKAQKKYKDVLEEIQKYTHLSSLSPSKEMDEKHFEIINK